MTTANEKRQITKGKVPLAQLREAFLESGESAGAVARRMGYLCPRYDGRGKLRADTSRLKRNLGLRSDNQRMGKPLRQYIDYDMALQLAEAIGVDPVDVGL